MTIDNVRTALVNLEATGEIIRTVRNHYQIITVVNYEMYQTDVAKKPCQIPSNPDVKSRATAMSNPNNQRIKERKKERIKEPPKSPNGGLDSPSGEIPEIYRGQFKTYEEYLAWRNQ